MSVRSLLRTVSSQTYLVQQASRMFYSINHGKKLNSVMKTDKGGAHDMVGEPNPVTNLRPMKFHVPKNETEIERKYRLKREEVQKWNDLFWTRHNTHFFKEKEEYIKYMKKSKAKDGKDCDQNVTADEMSSFYAQFLNDNWNRHLLYNFEWYKKNASLVTLSLQVKLSHLKERLFSRRKKST